MMLYYIALIFMWSMILNNEVERMMDFIFELSTLELSVFVPIVCVVGVGAAWTVGIGIVHTADILQEKLGL